MLLPRRMCFVLQPFPADSEKVYTGWLSPVDHSMRCDELAAMGYSISAITAASQSTGQEFITASLWFRNTIPELNKDRLAKRKALVVLALIRLGFTDEIWPLLDNSDDQRILSYIIHFLRKIDIDPLIFTDKLKARSTASSLKLPWPGRGW